MNDIKELKQLITETMIPQIEIYLEEFLLKYKNSTIEDKDKEIIRNMESFLVEFENILLLITQNKITEIEALETHQKILSLLEEDDK